jgi:uncharacterized repeat protein (TIGR01451 family)
MLFGSDAGSLWFARWARSVFTAVGLAVVLALAGASVASANNGVQVSMSGSPSGTVAFGTTLTYTITVTNPSNESAFLLSDQVSGLGNIQLSSTLGTCTQSAGLVTCLNPNVPQNQSRTVTISGTVIASSGSTLRNTATVGGNPGEEQFSNSATVETLVTGGPGPGPVPPTALPDLTPFIIAPSTVPASSQFTYSWVISNIGAGPASNIEAVDNLPAGVSATVTDTTNLFTCKPIVGKEVICTGGRIDAGTSATITITATAPASGTFTDLTVVNPLVLINESNELNNTASAQTTIGPGPYTGTVTSSQKTITGMNTTKGLPIGEAVTGKFIPEGTTITAILSASSIEISTNATGSATGEALSFAPPLAVKDEASPGPAPPNDVRQGEKLTYTVTVKNEQALEHGLTFGDMVITVPTQGLDPSSIVASIAVPPADNTDIFATCGVEGSVVQCYTIGNDESELELTPQASLTVTVSGTVIGTPSGKLYVTPTVTGNQQSGFAIQAPTMVTQVKPAIDLSVTKASLPPTVNAAAPFKLEYVVGNSGLSPAAGVLLRDPLPAGFLPPKPPSGGLYTFSAGGGFKCSIVPEPTPPANVLECKGGTVPAQETVTITVNVVAPETTGTYASTVTVDPNNALPESDEANNTATATTTVTTGVDLCVAPIPPTVSPNPTNCGLTATQSVDNNPVAPNGTLTYTIPVANQGTQDVTGVEVDDTLPVGTIFRSAKGDHNFTCSDQGATVKCVGGIINGTYTQFPSVDTATIKISVFAPAAPGKITNVVRVDPNNAIPEIDKENNISSLTTEVELKAPPQNGEYIELHFTPEGKGLTSTPLLGAAGEPVAPNGTVTYAMVVANTGTEQAFNVEVQDTLPAGARYIGATGTGGFECSNAAEVVTCTGGSLAPNGTLGSTQEITIKAFAPPAPGKYTDQAIVNPNHEIPEADEANNTETVETVVEVPKKSGGNGTYIDLAVKASAKPNPEAKPPDTVLPDGPVTYTLTVTDAGSATAAYSVETDDSLPTGATFVSAKGSNGDTCELAGDGRTVKCLGATISPTTPDTITIVVDARNESSGPPGGAIYVGPNEAIVNPNNEIPESDTENNTATTERIEVKSKVNVKIEQSGPDTASQNDTPSYTLTVENEGEETARGVVVRDPLPVGLIVQNVASEPNNFACQVFENPVNVIECKGDLAAKEKATMTIGTFVTAADSTKLTNEACVNPDRTIVEYNYTDNCSTMVIGMNEPDLSVSQSASVSPVSPGGKEVYTIDVENIGTGKAEGSKMEDKLPKGEKFVSANGTNGTTCTESSGTVTCELGKSGELAKTAVTTITLTVEIEEGAVGPIENTSEATTTTKPAVETHNKATTTVSVNATGVDLAAVSLVTNQDPVNQGAVLTYTSVIKNLGVENAKNVLIRQELPTSGVSFISASASDGFECELVSTFVECKGAALNAGAMTTITVNVQVTAKAPASLASKIIADPKHEIKESNNTNQEKSITTSVTGATCTHCFDDVMGPIMASPSPVKTKDELTYTFAIGNSGDEPAPTPNTVQPGVVIDDELDSGLEFKSASATNGFKVEHEGNKIIAFEEQCGLVLKAVKCPDKEPSTLAAGAGVIVTVKTKVEEPGSPKFPFMIKNKAVVNPLVHEFKTTNNEATNETEVTGKGPLVRGLPSPLSAFTSAANPADSAAPPAKPASCRLPSFRRMSKAQAHRALTKARCSDVVVRFHGKGARVVHQAIRSGTVIDRRTVLVLRLGRA